MSLSHNDDGTQDQVEEQVLEAGGPSESNVQPTLEEVRNLEEFGDPTPPVINATVADKR